MAWHGIASYLSYLFRFLEEVIYLGKYLSFRSLASLLARSFAPEPNWFAKKSCLDSILLPWDGASGGDDNYMRYNYSYLHYTYLFGDMKSPLEFSILHDSSPKQSDFNSGLLMKEKYLTEASSLWRCSLLSFFGCKLSQLCRGYSLFDLMKWHVFGNIFSSSSFSSSSSSCSWNNWERNWNPPLCHLCFSWLFLYSVWTPDKSPIFQLGLAEAR